SRAGCSSLKTVPQPMPSHPVALPPWSVVPYRLPAVSRNNPAIGPHPSVSPLAKLCNTVSRPCGLSLNTTPQPNGFWSVTSPPKAVTPYRFPLLSLTSPCATGLPPSAPDVKLYSTVSVPLLSTLKTAPRL